MKLPGYLDPSFTPSAPSIYAQIESAVPDLRGTVAFLIDTGASVTTIMDRDRERLGIDWKRLDKTTRPLMGIGGSSTPESSGMRRSSSKPNQEESFERTFRYT